MGKASGRRVCKRENIKDDLRQRRYRFPRYPAEEESAGPWKEYLRKAGAMASSRRYPLRGEFREERVFRTMIKNRRNVRPLSGLLSTPSRATMQSFEKETKGKKENRF